MGLSQPLAEPAMLWQRQWAAVVMVSSALTPPAGISHGAGSSWETQDTT